jgi:monoterpene epsilon-lactone hydrolase
MMAHLIRRNALKLATRLGVGFAGGAFVVGRSGFMIADNPPVSDDEVPSEPGLIGVLLYGLILTMKTNSLPPLAQQRAEAQQAGKKVKLPPGTSNEAFSAAGVPTLRICASGASKSRYILYLHSGGFENYGPATYLPFAAAPSRVTNACVLLPNYRLAPEHPFPAALNDCLAVYRWLLQQGVTASHVAIVGDSVGGTLTLATALALHDHADPLPVALTAMSPVTDFALTGNSIKTKASVDPVNTISLMDQVIAACTAHGATRVLNPLVSPLYADVHSLPPTLIQVGTREMLLDDSTRMASNLHRAGVAVKLEIWPGMWHVFPLSITFPFGNLLPERRWSFNISRITLATIWKVEQVSFSKKISKKSHFTTVQATVQPGAFIWYICIMVESYRGGEKSPSFERAERNRWYDTIRFPCVGFSSYCNRFFWSRHWLLRLGWTSRIRLSCSKARDGSYNGPVGSMDARFFAVYYRRIPPHWFDLVSGF